MELKRTPLYDCHVDAGARLVPFAGYEMPVRYGSQVDEHHAVRRAAGLFDVSHMGEIWIKGPQAEEFLCRLLPNDVRKLRDGRAQYNALLLENGCFLDDLLVYRIGKENYLLVVNASLVEEDLAWIVRWAGDFGVEIDDRSATTALIAVQGPAAPVIVRELADFDPTGLKYYSFAQGRIADCEALVSRTGYTGEDGFELYVEAARAAELWRALLKEGAVQGLVPVGLAARDTLRLEAGMLLSGQDIGDRVTPWEVGLDWVVKLDDRDFVGRAALERQAAEGIGHRLVGLEMPGRAIPRYGYNARLESSGDGASREAGTSGNGTLAKHASGFVTSGTWSPTMEHAIGLALIEGNVPAPAAGTKIEVEIRGEWVAGRTVALPFYRRPR